jgi:hypothetical protein
VRPVADVLLKDSAHGLPTDLDSSRPQSLEDIVKVYDADDQAAVRRELTSAGFVEDHDQVWSAGLYTDDTRRVELIQLYRFRTPQGACRYAKAAAARAILKPTSSAIPGTYGTSYDGPVLNSASLQATKGPYYLVASALATKESVQGWPAPLLKAQFDRL